MNTTPILTIALLVAAAGALGAQVSTTRNVGNSLLGGRGTLSADTWSGSSAGGTCENRLWMPDGTELVRTDARARALGRTGHEQRVRIYVGGTLLFYRNQSSSSLIEEDANESISGFFTQSRLVEVDVTGTEPGTGGPVGGPPRLALLTTFGARGQPWVASARTSGMVGADVDLRTSAWSSSASLGSAGPATAFTRSEVSTTFTLRDRLWFSMQASPMSAGGTLHAMPSRYRVRQNFSAKGAMYPLVYLTPTMFTMVPIAYVGVFDESRTLVDDTKDYSHHVFSVF